MADDGNDAFFIIDYKPPKKMSFICDLLSNVIVPVISSLGVQALYVVACVEYSYI